MEDQGLVERSPEDTRGVVQRSFERTVGPGEIIFDAGDAEGPLFVIQAGEVELARPGPEGPHGVARLGPGDLFGERSVLLGGHRRLRATAVSSARLLELEGATLQAMCLDRPEIALRLVRKLAGRVIDLEQRLSALGVDDLLRPVVRVFARRAEPGEEGARVAIPLRRIAHESGLSMLEAHRALQQLLEERLVKLVDDVLHIPDLDALLASIE
ncbi:MAG: Crp/Fnr family transcriptional regulator [Myxococcota bacterium]